MKVEIKIDETVKSKEYTFAEMSKNNGIYHPIGPYDGCTIISINGIKLFIDDIGSETGLIESLDSSCWKNDKFTKNDKEKVTITFSN